MKKRNISLSIVFVLFMMVGLFVLDHVYSKLVAQLNDKPLWAQKFKNKRVDFLILGSSRSENSVDVKTIEDKTRLKGLNIAYGGSAFSENYLALYTFLKNGNRCNTVLLNADEWGVIEQSKAYNYPFHGYYYFDSLGDDTIARLIKENYGVAKYLVWRFIPFVRFAEFNNVFNPVNFFKSKTVEYDEKGSALLSAARKKKWQPGRYPMEPESYSILNLRRIVNLCQQNEIQVILFNSPNYYEVNTKAAAGREKCLKVIRDISVNNDLVYLDYSLTDTVSYSMDFFYNQTHLNETGARIFSSILAGKMNNKNLK